MTSSKGNRRFICPGAAVAELWVSSLMFKEKKPTKSPPHVLPTVRRTGICLLHPWRAPAAQAFSRRLRATNTYKSLFLQPFRDLGISTTM